jgi:recyclin-1
MLGHVYVVEDARDLAQIVRDVTRYGGAYRPEVCLFLDVTGQPPVADDGN